MGSAYLGFTKIVTKLAKLGKYNAQLARDGQEKPLGVSLDILVALKSWNLYLSVKAIYNGPKEELLRQAEEEVKTIKS